MESIIESYIIHDVSSTKQLQRLKQELKNKATKSGYNIEDSLHLILLFDVDQDDIVS